MIGLMLSKLPTVLLAEEGLDDRIFGIDFQTLGDSVVTLIAVMALFILLSYLLFNPTRELLKKRQDKIKNEMESAASDRQQATAFKVEYDSKLSEIHSEADDILSRARKNAMKKEADIVKEAKSEATRILERANKEVELEKNKVKDQVKQEMIAVASMMASKMVAVSMNDEKQAELIAETLKEMGEETWQS